MILGKWFHPSKTIELVEAVETGMVGNRHSLSYRLQVTIGDSKRPTARSRGCACSAPASIPSPATNDVSAAWCSRTGLGGPGRRECQALDYRLRYW